MDSKGIVLSFWKEMATNDFYKASEWLSEDFEGYWPQSSELIVGRNNFAEINKSYPAYGKWKFQVNAIISEGNQVVTDVSVTDGKQKGQAITFHTVENGLIVKQIEYWPDEYAPPGWRSQWVQIIPTD